jgi:hypothetical protein
MIKAKCLKNISLLLGLALILSTSLNISPSIAKTRCGNTDPVEASSATRTLKLDKFGIQIKIPTNYRSVLLNDGSVAVLDPGSYEAVRCAAPHGFQGFYIKLLPNNENLSLEEIATTNYSSHNDSPIRLQNYTTFNSTQALLIDFQGGLGSYGIFNVPGKGVVEMSAGCDCDVTVQDVIPYLDTVEFIDGQI